MTSTADERMGLMLRLRDIQQQDEHRKSLIRLCVMKVLSLRKDSAGSNLEDDEETTENDDETSQQAPRKAKTPPVSSSVPPSSQQLSDSDALQKRINAFEVQVASLKMSLATKEQAHAAKVDELKNEIERLSEQKETELAANKAASVNGATKPRPGRGRPRLASRGSPVSKQTRPVSSFFANSPFSDSKTGKGNSFSGVGIASVAAQASFKLSRSSPKPTDEVFSPNNSSTESTPRNARNRSDALGESSPIRARKVRAEKSEKSENSSSSSTSNTENPDKNGSSTEHAEASTTSLNLTVSDPEETFQSANATFESEKDKKNKRKKIRLVSSEASKLILASSGKTHDGEGDDVNSFKYYQDDNFGADVLSPVAPQKRPTSAEPAVKKKHVFKIA